MAASQAQKDAYKVMRRGTRACRRRRKIKCIYNDDASEICQECAAHSRECSKQGTVRAKGHPSSSAKSVRVQVTRLESAVEKLERERNRADEPNPTVDATRSDRQSNILQNGFDTLGSDYKRKAPPVFALFDNDILHQKDVLDAYTIEFPSSIQFPQSTLSDRDKLLSTISNIPNILQVLHFASDWWISWREQHFALRKVASNRTLYDFVQSKLSEDSPIAVALGLMAVAMALGQVRPGIDDMSFNLPVPANHITNHILAAVDQVICDSKEYQLQNDSIILFMMRAKHHTENNQLRKAWLRIRQGISCAQAINFGSLTSAELSEEAAEQQRFLASIFEMDRLISMILGLPYAVDPAFTDVRAFSVILDPSVEDESLKMRALRRIIAITAGHVNDRNAQGHECRHFADSTQATLDMVAGAMPVGWWDLAAQPLSGLAAHRYESIMVQLWFWTVQTYLHLPYLIKPREDGPYPHYRQLCLQGTRNLLQSFVYLRTEPSVSVYMCNCDDFQALLGACILLVGTLQNASKLLDQPAGDESLETYESCASLDADLALIEELKEIFRYRMHEQGGIISKQGLAVLEELTCFLYDDDDQHTELDGSQTGLTGMNIGINREQKTIMLPYFGTIRVELTKKIPKRRTTCPKTLTMPTPPRSTSGSQGDLSPGLQSLPKFSPSSFSEATPDDLADQPQPFFGSIMQANPYHGTNKNDSALNTASEVGQDLAPDLPQMAPIAWDQWENYMFNQELGLDWNSGSPWTDTPFR
ncbi:hypothetical protein LTS08_006945 [Lithohypha guttulata]|nr:hypothetical protein LTS08_006945 [Lithohypha guttulata]